MLCFGHSRPPEKGKDSRLGQSPARLGQSLPRISSRIGVHFLVAVKTFFRVEKQQHNSQLQHVLRHGVCRKGAGIVSRRETAMCGQPVRRRRPAA
jgi:hypothetical protein